jgi:hypothetical protein
VAARDYLPCVFSSKSLALEYSIPSTFRVTGLVCNSTEVWIIVVDFHLSTELASAPPEQCLTGAFLAALRACVGTMIPLG